MGADASGCAQVRAATQASATGGGPGQRGAMQAAEARAGTTPGWGAPTRTVGRQHGGCACGRWGGGARDLVGRMVLQC